MYLQPILTFLQCQEQHDLQKHQLSNDEWMVLQLIHEILSVWSIYLPHQPF